MFNKLSRKLFHSIGSTRNSVRCRLPRCRGLFIEPLESRQLLSVTLSSIGNQSLLAGAPLNLALNGESENALTYEVSVSNSDLTATVSQDNPSIRIHVEDADNNIDGDITLQLFEDLAPDTVDQIMAFVNSGYYDGLIFHRVDSDFVIQGGDPDGDGTGGPGFKFDDEFNAELQFTGAGLLAMANSGVDTNGSQFFITLNATRWLDYEHTIFGMVTEGQDIIDQIEQVPVDGTTPVSDVVMTSVTVIDDTEDAVLRLSADSGITGTVEVTVTVTDMVTNETTYETFEVTITPDTYDNLPFLEKIDPIVTSADTPITIDIPATDVDGDDIRYFVAVSPYSSNLDASIDESTGELTITPKNGAYGVYKILVHVAAPNGTNYDTQAVPVYVNPPAPTSVTLVAASDTGGSDSDAITSLNNSTGQTLDFEIVGVEIGALVELYADGQLIGETVAAGTTVTITTDGTTDLADGDNEFTVKQTIEDEDVVVGNLETTVDLVSELSAPLTVTIDTIDPIIVSPAVTTAYAEGTYIYQLSVADANDGITYSLQQAPTGMTIDPDTGRITWTSVTGAGTTEEVIVRATDAAGNSSDQTFNLSIEGPNTTPVLAPDTPDLGTTDEDTAVNFSLTVALINNGDGTSIITDADETVFLGGIAVIGLTGNGTWAYSLDGTTYIDIGNVSDTSALLLPSDASLRYTPDGDNAETATISYVAWDGTTGHNGIDGVDTTSGGDHSAFSSASDIATLAVTAVNDAPVLTPAEPSAGTIGPDETFEMTPSDYVNNGDGTTTITDPDNDAVIGGIALVGLTGSGTWEYSLDGTNFVAIVSLSNSSALLLPGDATLRYTPSTGGGETATIKYRAWDATSGTAGELVDTSTNGGETAFSIDTDVVSLTVTQATGSISGYVYVDTDNNGSRFTTGEQSQVAMQNVVVKLHVSDGQGNWTLESTVSTGADGSYMFDNLLPGTYRVQEVQPHGYLDGKDSLGNIDGVVVGTVLADTLQLELGANENAVEYNFGERGLTPGLISLRNYLASSIASANVTPPAPDHTAPAGYSITATDSLIGGTDAAGFQFSGAEVGATYNYTITSSGGGDAVTGSGTITSASQVVSEIDVSDLLDGAMTISVTLTDQSGNVGPVRKATATLDWTAPAGYTITLDDDYLEEADASDTKFQINNGEIGATYSYIITSDGGDGVVSGNGTISSTAQLVNNVDVSGLPDGTLTFKVLLSDPAGNIGTVASATAALDQAVPAGYSVSADDEFIGESATTSITLADAEPGTTYKYTVTSSGGGTPVTGEGTVTSADQKLENINVSGLNDGELTFTVTLTDIGDKTGEAVTCTAKLDRVAPADFTITPDHNVLDAETVLDTGFWLIGAEPYTIYAFTIESDGGGDPITGSDEVTLSEFYVDELDLSSLPDGTLTISVTLTDGAGNVSNTITTTIDLDTSGD